MSNGQWAMGKGQWDIAYRLSNLMKKRTSIKSIASITFTRLRIAFCLFCLLSSSFCLRAQDTLPKFSVVSKANNLNLVTWTNLYPKVSQISIQRSKDSLRNFVTVMSVPDPNLPQNGFSDNVSDNSPTFYRLFIVLGDGKYVFTQSRKPAPDTSFSTSEPILQDNQRVLLSDSLNNREVNALREKIRSAEQKSVAVNSKKFFVVKRHNVYSTVHEDHFKKFRDSIVYTTRDTLVFASVDTVHIKPFVYRPMFRASRHVYTEKYGNVMISLPDAGKKKYSVRFFEDYNTPLFDIEEVTSTSLVVDKTNFVRSGWFWFELYENGTMKERHKFFIPKDF